MGRVTAACNRCQDGVSSETRIRVTPLVLGVGSPIRESALGPRSGGRPPLRSSRGTLSVRATGTDASRSLWGRLRTAEC